MKIHIVKQGDTLFEIAKKHAISLEQVIAANPQIANPDSIQVGDKVKIPLAGKTTSHSAVNSQQKYTVVQGDTLWKLAKAWNVPLKVLMDANSHLNNPNVLMVGDTIYIPKSGSYASPGQGSKAGWLASIGKANTGKAAKLEPVNVIPQTPKKPDVPDVVIAPIQQKKQATVPATPKAQVSPTAQKQENVSLPAAEKPVSPIAQKPVSPIAQKPVSPIAQKPVSPIAQKPVSPIAQKPVSPAAVSPTVTIAQKPVSPNTVPAVQGASNQAYPSVNSPLSANVSPLDAVQEPSQQGSGAMICPPLPQFQSPYANYPFPQALPLTHSQQPNQPYAYNPFLQTPVTSAPVMANPYHSQAAEWSGKDCGCGKGVPSNISYAGQADQQPVYAPVPYPYGMPAHASAQQHVNQQWPGYYSGTGEELQTYATPYANPYAFAGYDQSAATPSSEAPVNVQPQSNTQPQLLTEAVENIPVKIQEADKSAVSRKPSNKAKSSSSKHSGKQHRNQSGSKRKLASESSQESKNSHPWINM